MRWRPAEREARYANARRRGRPPVVTEGDSWFDYPMYRNIIDRIDDRRRFALKRLEFSGDTVRNMIGAGDRWRGLASLKAVVEYEQPRFVLFSGGGNDIVGEQIRGAIRMYDGTRSAEWHIDTDRWHELTRYLRDAYEMLIATIGPHAPVLAHGYDYIVPVDRGAKYDGWTVAGPWVWPEMRAMQVPAPMQVEIGRAMIDRFNAMLEELERANEHTGSFAHIDLRGTIGPGMWANEIHPTARGFEWITERFLDQLDRKLPGVLLAHDRLRMGIV